MLRPLDVTVPQYAALAVPTEQPGVSGARLARQCGSGAGHEPGGGPALLEERGLVARTPSEDHARVLLAALTPTGATLLRDTDAAAMADRRRLAAAYTDRQRAQLRALLQTAIDTLTTIRQETHP